MPDPTKIIEQAIWEGLRLDDAEERPGPHVGEEMGCIDGYFKMAVVADHVAEAVREAHTIRTPEQLSALPVGSVVIDADNEVGHINRTGPRRGSRKFLQWVGGCEAKDNPNTWTDVRFPVYAVPGYRTSWGEDVN